MYVEIGFYRRFQAHIKHILGYDENWSKRVTHNKFVFIFMIQFLGALLVWCIIGRIYSPCV